MIIFSYLCIANKIIITLLKNRTVMKTKNNFKSENEIRVAIINLLGATTEPFALGKSVTVGPKGSKTKIAAIETAGQDEVYITAESNSDICWDDLTLAEQKKLYKAIENQVINNQNSNNMEEKKNEAVETAQVENENVKQQAPAVENQGSVEAPAEEQPAEEAEAPAEAPAKVEKKEEELPEIPEPGDTEPYEASSILLSKSIEEVDADVAANEKLMVSTFKQLVECWPGARFTQTAKTKGIVTAGAKSMAQLTDALQKMYKRSILIKAL